MSMDLGITGVKRQAKFGDTPSSFMRKLVEKYHGRKTREQILAMFVEECERKRLVWFDALVDYFAANSYERFAKKALSKQRARRRDAFIEQEAQRLLSSPEELMAYRVNGTPLREMTGAECAVAGGFLLKVAAKVKPRQIVGEVLTEEQLRKLLS